MPTLKQLAQPKGQGASKQVEGEKLRLASGKGGKSGTNRDDSPSQRRRGDDPVVIDIAVTLVGEGQELMRLTRRCTADVRISVGRVGSKLAITIFNAGEVSGDDE